MGFQELNGLDADVTISLGGVNRKTGKPNPVKVEGYYLGKKSIPDNKKKSGVSYIYFFQTDSGNVGVWGKTDMDKKMSVAQLGTMMRITSTGKRPTPNGDMYTYKVEGDPENTIDVTEQASSEVSGGSIGVTGDFNDQDSDAAFEALAPTAEDEQEVIAAATAAKRARTQALLSKNSKKA